LDYQEVSDYVTELVGEGDQFRKWVYEKSQELSELGVHPIDPTRGRFLELLARVRSPNRVLEVGSGAGYSALWFMEGMGRKGTLDAIEVNPRVAATLKQVATKAGLQRRINIHHGSALEILRHLKRPYDIVFIDADKDEYPEYLDHALRLTKPGAIILADNMLWSGAAVRGDKTRIGVEGIMEYTKRIFTDTRLTSIIIPLGDGLAMSYRVT
jgi:predicted O-methyltransferase YrrM